MPFDLLIDSFDPDFVSTCEFYAGCFVNLKSVVMLQGQGGRCSVSLPHHHTIVRGFNDLPSTPASEAAGDVLFHLDDKSIPVTVSHALFGFRPAQISRPRKRLGIRERLSLFLEIGDESVPDVPFLRFDGFPTLHDMKNQTNMKLVSKVRMKERSR